MRKTGKIDIVSSTVIRVTLVADATTWYNMVRKVTVGRIRKAQQHRSLSVCGRLCILDASRDASLYDMLDSVHQCAALTESDSQRRRIRHIG